MTTTTVDTPPHTAVCQRCGCVSTLPKLFPKIWGKLLCPACAAKRALRTNQVIYGVALFLILFNIFGLWLLTGRPGQTGLDLLLMLFFSLLLLVLHELSHAAMAWLLGGRIFGIHLGVGKLLLQRWLGNFYLGVSLLPASGLCFAGFPPISWPRLRYGLMVAAGPLFHLLLLLLLLPRTRAFLGLPGPGWLIMIFILNAFMLALNLWPFLKVHTAVGVAGSDGSQLWRLLRGKVPAEQIHQGYYQLVATFALQQKRDDQALAEVAQGLARYPDNQILRNLHGYLLLRSDQLPASLAIWQELIDAPPAATIPPEQQPLIQALHYNNYAWVRLMLHSEPAHLAAAADYAERAFAMVPWLAPIRGTLAAVKVAQGDYAAGVTMALAAAADYQQDPSPTAREGRGSNLATAALGYHGQGNAQEARRLLAEAQALAPKEIAVRQAAAAIQNGPDLVLSEHHATS